MYHLNKVTIYLKTKLLILNKVFYYFKLVLNNYYFLRTLKNQFYTTMITSRYVNGPYKTSSNDAHSEAQYATDKVI